MDQDAGKVLDELLVVTARAGSAPAFRQVVMRWTPRLRRHAERLLFDADQAGDVVQDAWLGIARGLARLDDPARFPAWAYAIVTRRSVDFLRRRMRDRRLAADTKSDADTARDGAEGRFGVDDRLDLIAAIRRLPMDQRLVVSLHYGEDLSVEEIAAAHGLPVGTVKSRLHTARHALKAILQGDDDDQG